MKQTINFYDFCRAFETMDRNTNFSYEGKQALFDYLEQYEDDIGEEIELDVIALCCDYTEWEDLEEFQAEHSKNFTSLEDIEEETQVIRITDGKFITQNF